MRQWWIVYFKPMEDNPIGHFLPNGIYSQNCNRENSAWGSMHCFSCFPDMVINKKKCRCSDSLLCPMTVFHPFIRLLLLFILCCCFLNSSAHAVLRTLGFFLSLSLPAASLSSAFHISQDDWEKRERRVRHRSWTKIKGSGMKKRVPV